MPKLIYKRDRWVCPVNPNHKVIVGEPEETSYCADCVKEQYDKAPRCPMCGAKKGFSMGTGDCAC